MSIAIAHDYLTQRGGAERVVLSLARLLPNARIHTSVYNAEGTYPEFREHDIATSPLQAVAAFRKDPRFALPLLPAAWSTMSSNADVVIASTSGWAHGIRTKPGCLKLVYCHNPARWLYQPDDYFRDPRVRKAATGILSPLVHWDRRRAANASVYFANSRAVADRIRSIYGIDPQVVHPPIDIDVAGEHDPDENLETGFWLTVGRGRGYKNTQNLIEAFKDVQGERLVVVGTPPPGQITLTNVVWTGVVSDARLRWLYANARALVSVSHEDFGLTPLEANAFGTPSLLLKAGGFLDSMDEGISGCYIDDASPMSIKRSLREFPSFDPALVKAHATKFGPAAFLEKLLSASSESLKGKLSTELRPLTGSEREDTKDGRARAS